MQRSEGVLLEAHPDTGLYMPVEISTHATNGSFLMAVCALIEALNQFTEEILIKYTHTHTHTD